MSIHRRLAVAAAVSTAVVGLTTVAGPASAAPPAHAGKKIVVLNDGADSASVAKDHGKRFGATVSNVYSAALRGYAATIPDSKLDAVRKDPRVLFVADDAPVELFAQSLPTGVDRIQAELGKQAPGNGSGAVTGLAVAVIDTGSGPHPDLNIAGGVNCSTGKSYNDGNGHGTHVAGTIGAKDDANGVVGVAPGVPIYSVRVLNDRGSGANSSIICGIDWVTANAARLGIKVASMSLGSPGADDGNCGNTNRDAMHKAICRSVAAGVTYVAASGNSNIDMASTIPAAYDEVLTVNAVSDSDGAAGGLGPVSACNAGADDTPATFSNFTTVGHADAAHSIAAPGVCINSTYKGGGYVQMSGTSMAAPHVSGAAAACIASGACTDTTPAGVRAKLLADAAAQPASYGFVGDAKNPLPPVSGKTRYYGHMLYAGSY